MREGETGAEEKLKSEDRGQRGEEQGKDTELKRN